MPTSSLICSLVLSLSVPPPLPSIMQGSEFNPALQDQTILSLAEDRANAIRGTLMGRDFINGHFADLIIILDKLSPEDREAALAEAQAFVEANTTPEEQAWLRTMAKEYVGHLEVWDFTFHWSLMFFSLLGLGILFERLGKNDSSTQTGSPKTLSDRAKEILSALAVPMFVVVIGPGLWWWMLFADEIPVMRPRAFELDEFLKWLERL